MAKRIIISVISDLCTDQRVHRAALTLHQNGFEVCVVGRKLKHSLPVNDRPYKTKRFNLIWSKGACMYAAFNLRLFVFLLFKPTDVFFANDLDTLLPNYLISKIRNKKLIYDSHEFFTGVPELQNRKLVRGVWEFIESSIFKKLKYVYTVNQSIATIYSKKYNVPVGVVRNIPMISNSVLEKSKAEYRNELGLPLNKFIVILQGSGINIHRGAEEAIGAMQFVDDAILIIAGGGDVFDELKNIVSKFDLHSKVLFKSRMPYDELLQYTRCADLGLTLDKSNNINYKFSLPNKLFDYLHCGVPVLTSDLPEVKKVVEQYKVGMVVESVSPTEIAKCINVIRDNQDLLNQWNANLKIAKDDLNWDKEKQVMLDFLKS